MPEFDTLVADALGFFDDLAADNSRDWFAANKARYERAVKAPAEALLAEIAVQIATATGAAPETKLYRINRDLRFSKDKTPYSTICTCSGATRRPGSATCSGSRAPTSAPASARWVSTRRRSTVGATGSRARRAWVSPGFSTGRWRPGTGWTRRISNACPPGRRTTRRPNS
ncbi:MAG: DUF2461 family protein [Paracoccaceae bacterium]